MRMILNLCLFLVGIAVIDAIPYNVKSKREFGRQPMVIRGYYVPKNRRSTYFPQGVMTAYANGDMIAANSYMGEQTPLTYYEPEEKNKVRDEPQEAATDFDLNESNEDNAKDQVFITTEKPKNQKPELPSNNKNKDDDDDDDDNNYWPFNRSGNRAIPSYNAFFPIMFGGGYSNNHERRTEQRGYPGAATAIANSFSTGKGGVASSHATAYGDPYLSTLLRNGNGLKKGITSDTQE